MGVPLVGCATHRLNLAVRTLTQAAKLRLKTSLRPKLRQETRWGSTFAMLARYFELREFISADDEDLAELMPSSAANRRLKALLLELVDIESVSMKFQSEELNFLDARDLLDGLLEVKPTRRHYLAPNADIVPAPDFENGVVKVLGGRVKQLSRAEKAALRPFEREASAFAEATEETTRLFQPGSHFAGNGMDGVVLAVERSIAAEIPARFGSLLDGWTHASEHYIAVFVCYEVNGCLKTPLPGIAPLLDAQDDDLCVPLLNRRNYERLKTPLRPVIRQNTRRSSTFDMVQRYLKLLEFLDVEDDDIMELLPSPAANKRLSALYQELRDIEFVAKVLQGQDVDLIDVREWFDELIAIKPQYTCPDLSLTVLKPFEATRLVEEASNAEDDDTSESYVERLRKRRRFVQDCVTYEQLKSIPPASNVVEIFFSIARVTFGHHRHGLLSLAPETILFLRQNRSNWDTTTVVNLR
ncbi:hypothetical protein ON010_g5458 [Phytophthora cinnamomi]|nr:hypothetical protein ON010_g5458 [Phytophthora cinnamomi]